MTDLIHFMLHDLRRTFGTGCAKLKIAPHLIELMLNHVPQGEAATYNKHSYETEMREAWTAWAAHIEQITR